MYQFYLALYEFVMTLICFNLPMYMYKLVEYDMICHTCRRYELKLVKDMTHGNSDMESEKDKIYMYNMI